MDALETKRATRGVSQATGFRVSPNVSLNVLATRQYKTSSHSMYVRIYGLRVSGNVNGIRWE